MLCLYAIGVPIDTRGLVTVNPHFQVAKILELAKGRMIGAGEGLESVTHFALN